MQCVCGARALPSRDASLFVECFIGFSPAVSAPSPSTMIGFVLLLSGQSNAQVSSRLRRSLCKGDTCACLREDELVPVGRARSPRGHRSVAGPSNVRLRRQRCCHLRTVSEGATGGGGGSGGRGGGGGGGGRGGDASGASPPQQPGLLLALFERYCRALERRPIFTKSITAALLNFFADLTAQYFEARKHPSDTPPGWQRRRTLSFAVIGLCFVGPGLHGWFSFLERAFPPSRLSLVGKLLIDQTLGAAAFNGVLLVMLYWLEHGGKFQDAWQSMKHRLPPTMIGNWKVWPAAQLVNFAFVPPAFRVLYVNSVSFFWTIYLSEIAHRTITKEEKKS